MKYLDNLIRHEKIDESYADRARPFVGFSNFPNRSPKESFSKGYLSAGSILTDKQDSLRRRYGLVESIKKARAFYKERPLLSAESKGFNASIKDYLQSKK